MALVFGRRFKVMGDAGVLEERAGRVWINGNAIEDQVSKNWGGRRQRMEIEVYLTPIFSEEEDLASSPGGYGLEGREPEPKE